jgi:hypothetical protein
VYTLHTPEGRKGGIIGISSIIKTIKGCSAAHSKKKIKRRWALLEGLLFVLLTF